jgi:hypothetical protein
MDYFEVITDAKTGSQIIRPYTPEEIEAAKKAAEEATANAVRAKRNTLLVESDWTQLPDAPVDAVAWAAYRQGLRDISDQPGFPVDVVWPVPPSA